MGVKSLLGMLGSSAAYRSLFKQVLENYNREFDPSFAVTDEMVEDVRAEPISKTRAQIVKWPSLTDWVDCPFPVLITYGERDVYGESRRFVERRFPGARLVVVEKAGHLPWRHNRDAFNRTLLEFYGIRREHGEP